MRSNRPIRLLVLGLVVLATLLVACGGKSEVPVTVTANTPTPTAAPKTPEPTPTSTPTPAVTRPAGVPQSGRWIEVDVTRYMVRLMDGTKTVQEIGPVAVGREIDTGIYESTQTGLFKVYVKTKGLTYDAPYKTYIDWWVGFDPDKANGFHSFLLDQAGKVVDAATGRVSNGCIRTGNPQAIFEYAEVGMPVWVHA